MRIVLQAVLAFGIFALPVSAPAASADPSTSVADRRPAQDEMRELKQRFEGRYRKVVKAKAEGTIGETFDGYLAPLAEAFLEDDADLDDLVEEENRDRKKLYELLARDVKDEIDEQARETVTPEIVAERNAKRNFRNAKDNEFLRMEDGVWIQKKDERDYEEILKLKKAGDVEEQDDGYLKFSGEDDDADARRAVDEENDRRRAMYKDIAASAESTADEIAREHAEAGTKRGRGIVD